MSGYEPNNQMPSGLGGVGMVLGMILWCAFWIGLGYLTGVIG